MLGLFATTLKCIDYKEWNAAGVRMNVITYIWGIIVASTRAIILCILLMICRGWGLNHGFIVDNKSKAQMISVAILYSIFSFFNEVEQQIYDFFRFSDIDFIFLSPTMFPSIERGKLVITITFYILSLYALNNIIRNVENERQRLNVSCYRTLRLIVLVSFLLGIGLAIYEMIHETAKTNFVIEENFLVPPSSTLDFSFVSVSILWTINYTFVIVSIAILWKPDQRAQFVELPSVDGCRDDDMTNK
ncbi:hypothetical protein CTEN210_11966 [Chaetoceros tenuissimus]|uniref:GOST seven transmembrane domain-containing protein n=1 Tax=Chaetoceros tenuissimus TaxID=426638 RepID=A0AAD3H9L9_9STRA|nr:hypothetical protein CTEN210_11966 [Chaetoceros tenuissimus]